MTQTFTQFAESHGLLIRHCESDSKVHRVGTAAHPKKRNGAYWYDGRKGWCQAWESDAEVVWWNDPDAKPWTDAERAVAERQRRVQAQERAQRARHAALRAADMLMRSELVTPRPGREWKPGRPAILPVLAHPYFLSKGFPNEPGFVLGGELLLIPMRDCSSNDLIGLQQIDRNGNKLYLKDQRSDMAVFVMGAGKAGTPWLAEGYATGLSLREALRRLYRPDPVIVCFSAGNLRKVAERGVGKFVCADNDESKAGEAAAIATGLPWTMPPTVGQDANDLMVAEGIEALVALVQALVRNPSPTGS